MSSSLPRVVFIAVFALAGTACGGEDPVAPVDVVNERFSLKAVEGERPPAEIDSVERAGEACVYRFLDDGSIRFSETGFELWLYQLLVCPSGGYPASERIVGSYVQEGGRVTLTADAASPVTTVTSARIVGHTLRMTVTRASRTELALEFQGQGTITLDSN